ncbi:MAG: phosphatase PAP2 family protein, partial [Erysipelotrichaceae bacterium]|nr:phosphatase PAP2 family protein [Erysipelotrichaceae bacterium]
IIMPGETEPEASFPTSHTMLALTVFCSAPWVGGRYLKDGNIRKIFTIVMYVLAAVMVVGRLLSGVHWFTDIIASILISATLLYAFRIVLDFIKPKKKTVRK